MQHNCALNIQEIVMLSVKFKLQVYKSIKSMRLRNIEVFFYILI